MRIKYLLVLCLILITSILVAATNEVARVAGQVTLESADVYLNQEFMITLNTPELVATDGITAFSFSFEYDSRLLEFLGASQADCIISEDIEIRSDGRSVIGSFGSVAAPHIRLANIVGTGSLTKVRFKATDNGTVSCRFNYFKFNEVAHTDLLGSTINITNAPDINDVQINLAGAGVMEGEDFFIELKTTELVELFDINGIQCDVDFNTVALQFKGLDFDNSLCLADSTEYLMRDEGITIQYSNDDALLIGSGRLVRLSFTALTPGETILSIGQFDLAGNMLTYLDTHTITITARPVITPIATIQDNVGAYDGTQVNIIGVVTIGTGVHHPTQLKAYIQDESGKGLMLFGYTATPAQVADIVPGNKLAVSGEIEEFSTGVTELKDISYTVLERNVEVPVKKAAISVVSDYATWEGTYVEISGMMTEAPYFIGGGYNINVIDNNNDEMTVRVWESTNIDVSSYGANTPLKACGIISAYNNASQVVPGYDTDLSIDATIPYFINIATNPAQPNYALPFDVTAQIIDDGKVVAAELTWWLAGQNEKHKVTMTANADSSAYTASLPAFITISTQPDEFMIQISATDDDDNDSVSPLTTIPIVLPIINNVTYSFAGISDYPLDYPFEKFTFVDDSTLVKLSFSDPAQNISTAHIMYRLESDIDYTARQMTMLNANTFEAYIPAQTAFGDVDDNIIFYTKLTYADGYNTTSPIKLIETATKAPLLYNLSIDNTPALSESLEVSVTAYDIDGQIDNVYVNYSVDYYDNNFSKELTLVMGESNKYAGYIPAQSAGSFVTISAGATDDTSLLSTLSVNNQMEEVEYTYPVMHHAAILKIEPRPFKPYEGENIEIRYNSAQGGRIILRIYNAEGKLITTPLNEFIEYSGTDNKYKLLYAWDGKDKNGNLVPLGLYICHLEIIEESTARKHTATAPIVVGARLK